MQNLLMSRSIVVWIVWFYSSLCTAEQINIAVASNFSHTIKTLVTEFESVSKHKVNVSLASSGKIYGQIINGAPFDLFFSADQIKPLKLEQEGWSIKGSRFTYAQGQLVLWSTKSNFLKLDSERLIQSDFNKLAMANPKLAPYGQAALQTLKNLNLVKETQHKWVQGENVSQAFQFVSSGNAELGLIALSQTLLLSHADKGAFWLVPSHLYQPIYQDVLLLKRAKHNSAAWDFLDFVQQPEAKDIIRASGYLTNLGLNPELESDTKLTVDVGL
jgi:molybdate transport system substrate-binding protein